MTVHRRGQSNVIGVALLLAITVVSMSVLTVSVGSLIDAQQARTEREQIATAFDRLFTGQPRSVTREQSIRTRVGTIRTAPRELTVSTIDNGSYQFTSTALAYESDRHRVGTVAGAVVGGRPGNAWFRTPPAIIASPSASVRIVHLDRIVAPSFGTRTGTVWVQTRERSHSRLLTSMAGQISIETETPGPFIRRYRALGRDVSRGDPDRDGVPSVQITLPVERPTLLVRTTTTVEVVG